MLSLLWIIHCDRLTCSRLAFDIEREVWAPRCCVFINNISNSRIFVFRWHTTDWSTCSRSCGNGCRHAMSSAVRRSTLQIMDQAQTVLLIKKNPAFLRRFDIVTASIAWLIGTRGATGKYLLFLEDLSIDHFQFCVSGSMRYYDGDVKLKGILKMNFYLSKNHKSSSMCWTFSNVARTPFKHNMSQYVK